MATITLDTITNAAKTDTYTQQLAVTVSQAAPATWQRAKLLPLVFGILIVIIAQEGLAQMLALPSEAKEWAERLGIPAELMPLVGLVAFGVLCWMGIRTYKRSMKRVRDAGLEDA